MAPVAGIFVFTLTRILLICDATTHWVVTEDGRIQSQPDTLFNMKRPYDLVAMMQQEERSDTMRQIQNDLASKADIKHNEEKSLGLEHTFYKTDPNCVAAGKPLAEFDLYISTLLPLENKGIEISNIVGSQLVVDGYQEGECQVYQCQASQHSVPDVYNTWFSDILGSPSAVDRCQGGECQASQRSVPDCMVAVDLDYSIHAFEHLEGVKDRARLSGSAELGLKNAVSPTKDIDEYGRLVAIALNMNQTSWVLYNMAAFFWRIKGNPQQAVECIRRALHYSPPRHKDVALINLGNVLHRAHYSNEAAIVVHAAVAVSNDLNVNHFTLGNIYAVLGEYNKSLICFENTLRIQPDFEVAERRRHAILCHYKLESALEQEHQRLHKTLVGLREYQAKHDAYRKHNERVQQEQVTPDAKLLQRVAYEQAKVRRDNSRHEDHLCAITHGDNRAVLPCATAGTSDQHAYLSHLFQQYNKEGMRPSLATNSETYDKPLHPRLYPKNLPPSPPQAGQEQNHDFVGHSWGSTYRVESLTPRSLNTATTTRSMTSQENSSDWPTKDDCDNSHNIPKPALVPSIYLPPQNKGFEVRAQLTVAQGLVAGSQHSLPWYPPICDPVTITKDNEVQLYGRLKSLRSDEVAKVTAKLPDPTLKPYLAQLVDDATITEEEIGQRILTALKQAGSKGRWVLYNVAGLYWMLRGHSTHGIECFRHALHLTPQSYRDVPLVSLASVLYRLGYYDDAGVLVSDALKVDRQEPATHALMGNVLWAKGNNSGAAWHYNQSLQYEPDGGDVRKMLLIVRCQAKFHASQTSINDQDAAACKGDKLGGSSDRKYICKMEEGEEKCVMEQPANDKKGCDCNKCFRTEHVDNADTSDLSESLDDMSEFYEKRGFCDGEDCRHIQIAQPSGQKSHIKLCMLDGQLHQKIILANSPNDIHVESHECLIYSDGSCSVGCNRDEYKRYLHSIDLKCNGGQVIVSNDAETKVTVKEETLDSGETLLHVTRESVKLVMREEMVPLQQRELPDTSIHLDGLSEPELPTLEECRRTKTVNFNHATSTWLAISSKGTDLKDHVDFDAEITETFREPFCTPPATFDGDITEYPGLVYPEALPYQAEVGLAKVLRYISGQLRPIAMTAMSIALAMDKNASSWVLASLASLYWRMEGNTRQAIECIKVGLNAAPPDKKDVALVSLANVLFHSGQYDDAIHVVDKALRVSRDPVITHFMLANIYAAKLDWDKAIMFYHSTLQRQATFKPARQRLTLIQCVKKLNFGG